MNEDPNKTFVDNFKRIAEHLRENGYASQNDLAKKLGLSQKTISNIFTQITEGRQIRLDTINQIAESLDIALFKLFLKDVTIDDLFSDKLDNLLKNYLESNEEGKEYIDRVAEKEVKYKK